MPYLGRADIRAVTQRAGLRSARAVGIDQHDLERHVRARRQRHAGGRRRGGRHKHQVGRYLELWRLCNGVGPGRISPSEQRQIIVRGECDAVPFVYLVLGLSDDAAEYGPVGAGVVVPAPGDDVVL